MSALLLLAASNLAQVPYIPRSVDSQISLVRPADLYAPHAMTSLDSGHLKSLMPH